MAGLCALLSFVSLLSSQATPALADGGHGVVPEARTRPASFRVSRVWTVDVPFSSRLAFAPDGARWAAAGYGTVSLWEGPTKRWTAEGGGRGELAFKADGAGLTTGDALFDTQTGQAATSPKTLSKTLATNGPNAWRGRYEIRAAAWFFGDDRLVVSAAYRPGRGSGHLRAPVGDAPPKAERSKLLLLDGRTREPIRTLWQGPKSEIHDAVAVVPEPDGELIAAATTTVRLFRRGGGPASQPPVGGLVELQGHEWTVKELAFRPDGNQLASGDAKGWIRLWDLEKLPRVQAWRAFPQPSEVAGLSFARLPTGAATPAWLLAAGSRDGDLVLWELGPNATSPVERYRTKLDAPVADVALAPDGKSLLVAVASDVPTVTLYRIQ